MALTAGRRLVDVRGTLDARDGTRPTTVGDAWLRVFVETDGPVPASPTGSARRCPNALDVHLVYDATADDETGPRRPVSARSIRATSSPRTSG